jgi:hypothetical protein
VVDPHGPSFLFVVIDIWRSTLESPVLKWAFVILSAFTGPLGAFFYVLDCREPLRGTHDEYIAARWRQVLGSTMHCVAGDGIGIVVAAAANPSRRRWPAWPGSDFPSRGHDVTPNRSTLSSSGSLVTSNQAARGRSWVELADASGTGRLGAAIQPT